MDYAARIARLRGLIAQTGANVALISRQDSIAYLCGFEGSFGDLVLGDGRAVLVTDGRYALRARLEASQVSLHVGAQWRESVPAVLREFGDRLALAYEPDGLSVARMSRLAEALPGFEFVPAEGLVDQLRAVKDAEELERIRRAAEITDLAWAALQPEIREGRTERELAVRLVALQYELGADGPAFQPIVASGPNSAMPHHVPGSRALRSGDLVKVDFGARYQSYCADLTRTVVIGEPSALQERMYDAVYRAQTAACAAMRPGALGEDLDRIARSAIEEAGFGDAFCHGLGHGLGMTKEPPHVIPGAVFEPGNVVTIEPGVYIEGVGGVRIEDLGVVTAEGFEVLSGAPKPPRLSQPSV